MLRFEMEVDLLEGKYPVSEAPAVWNQKMQEYLGITPPDDTLGILQDIHWAHGTMGYFPTYSLGNILSLQLYDQAVQDLPEIPEQIARGEFDGLRGWLTQHIYRYGQVRAQRTGRACHRSTAPIAFLYAVPAREVRRGL
jgi:carboxypeptidase Taq